MREREVLGWETPLGLPLWRAVPVWQAVPLRGLRLDPGAFCPFRRVRDDGEDALLLHSQAVRRFRAQQLPGSTPLGLQTAFPPSVQSPMSSLPRAALPQVVPSQSQNMPAAAAPA